MNQLLLNQTILSLEVAQMAKKPHKNLVRDIRRYCEQMEQVNEENLDQLKIEPINFFMESTYKDDKNREYPCYLVTKQGCEFIAHKMTGIKGTEFTARYIMRFHEMEESMQKQQANLPQLQKNRPSWFKCNADRMNKICKENNWELKFLCHKILKEIYDIYDINGIKRLYYKVYGKFPDHELDVVDMHQGIEKIANEYIDYLERNM